MEVKRSHWWKPSNISLPEVSEALREWTLVNLRPFSEARLHPGLVHMNPHMSVSVTPPLIQSWALIVRRNYVKTASFLHSLVFCFLFCCFVFRMDFKCKSQLSSHFDGRCAIYLWIYNNNKKCNAAKKGQFHRCLSFLFFFFLGLNCAGSKMNHCNNTMKSHTIIIIFYFFYYLFDWWYLNNTIWHVYCYKLAVFVHH